MFSKRVISLKVVEREVFRPVRLLQGRGGQGVEISQRCLAAVLAICRPEYPAPARPRLVRASCISVCPKRRVSGAISSLVLVRGQKVSRLSAAGGHKLNAIAKINDFQMICHLFLEPIRWLSLEIEFGNMRKRKKGNNKDACFIMYVGRRLGRITICSE